MDSMIENPQPENWQDLQNGVCKIFTEIGLEAETGKTVATPRGNIELDVFAIDVKSVDKIKYIIECKNWNKTIPQSVIHAFTTVMHEVGANIGFVISKRGMQSGAKSYTKNTNIHALTYEEFQQRYVDIWHENYFVPQLGNAADSLSEYVEPFNSYRDKRVADLDNTRQNRFYELLEKYRNFGWSVTFFQFPRYSHLFKIQFIEIDQIKQKIYNISNGSIKLKAVYFRDLLYELIDIIQEITDEFNSIFGEDIFSENVLKIRQR
jgi:restriction system protein